MERLLHQLRLVVYPIIYQGFSTIQTVVGVPWDFFNHQSVSLPRLSSPRCASQLPFLPMPSFEIQTDQKGPEFFVSTTTNPKKYDMFYFDKKFIRYKTNQQKNMTCFIFTTNSSDTKPTNKKIWHVLFLQQQIHPIQNQPTKKYDMFYFYNKFIRYKTNQQKNMTCFIFTTNSSDTKPTNKTGGGETAGKKRWTPESYGHNSRYFQAYFNLWGMWTARHPRWPYNHPEQRSRSRKSLAGSMSDRLLVGQLSCRKKPSEIQKVAECFHRIL